MADHALLSPSGAHRWLACPGSVAMESVFPRTSSDSAEYGTACHELAQWVLSSAKPVTCSSFFGKKTENGVKVDIEMAELVQVYVDHMYEYAAGNTLLVEQKVNFSKYTGVAESFGTSDAVVLTKDGELQVHDLKTGYHIVYAEDNPQLMLYALGALHEFGARGDFERIRLVIHQPSQDHLDEWDCSLRHLLKFAEKAKRQATLVMKAIKGNPEHFLQPDEDACKYCKAAAICPDLAKKVTASVGAEFDDLTLTEDATQFVPKNPEALAERMKATVLIENWIKAVRAEVERELLAGVKVPGYKIVQGREGIREWVDADEIIKLFKEFKLTKEQMYKFKLISPTEAEKLFKIAPDKWGKVKNFITRAEGNKSVAPEADPRPRIDIRPVIESFEDLTGNDLV